VLVAVTAWQQDLVQARKADLVVVVGPRSAGGIAGLLLDSVAERVISGASCLVAGRPLDPASADASDRGGGGRVGLCTARFRVGGPAIGHHGVEGRCPCG